MFRLFGDVNPNVNEIYWGYISQMNGGPPIAFIVLN